MGVPDSVRQRYARDESALQSLKTYVETTLAAWCSKQSYLLGGRVKTEESVAEKLETGRYAAWSKLDDLVAFTIVVPTIAHENQVVTKLQALFHETAVRSRGTTHKPPDVFRFDATRWYGTVHKDEEPPLEARATELVFEVQIKTAFENAWSTVTHDVVYKGSQPDWREKRLASQLKALVEQIDFLVDQFQTAATGIQASSDASTDAESLIAATFKELVDDGSLPDSLAPESWQRFSECIFALLRSSVSHDREAAKNTKKLCADFAQAIRGGKLQPAASGSLFQCVIGFMVNRDGPEVIDRFPVVNSSELKTFYGVDDVPKAIDLEN